MCEAKPGDRCATDTRGTATSTLMAYDGAYPNGPAVDPLTSGASAWSMTPQAIAAIDQDEKRLADAVRLRDEYALTDAATQRAWADARVKTASARAAAVSHSNSAREAADEALERARALYVAAGVNPRMANYYVEDMRLSAGVGDEIAVGRHERAAIVGDSARVQALINSKTPAIKVKYTGADRAPTTAAASASKTDAAFNAARARYEHERTQVSAAWNQHLKLARAAGPARFAANASERVAEQHDRNVRAVQHALVLTRSRAAAGLNMNGTAGRAGKLTAQDIAVNPDGTTNVWVMNEDSDDRQYERVTGVTPYALDSRQVMVTESGRQVLKVTHYSNYGQQTLNPHVWVEPPAPGARPISDVAPNLILTDFFDSGD